MYEPCTVVPQIASLEKEVQYYKDKHESDQRRIMELENKNREMGAQLSEQHMQIESLKEEMLVMRRPDEAMRDEVSGSAQVCSDHLLVNVAIGQVSSKLVLLDVLVVLSRRTRLFCCEQMSRVQADCSRMTHLLERTAEFKRLMEVGAQ